MIGVCNVTGRVLELAQHRLDEAGKKYVIIDWWNLIYNQMDIGETLAKRGLEVERRGMDSLGPEVSKLQNFLVQHSEMVGLYLQKVESLPSEVRAFLDADSSVLTEKKKKKEFSRDNLKEFIEFSDSEDYIENP